ncbi:MAG: apolipoprotein N-acyltransferase, partial [Sedimenticola sp.]|nr:apolipoprotein N-acyltransferase [Sedimenticola sp.]
MNSQRILRISSTSWLKHLSPWRFLAAFAAGALSVLAFAPFSFYLFALIGPLILLGLLNTTSNSGAFREGWGYGLGLLGFGVFWLHISIDQFGNMGTLAAIAITLLFVLILALYYGLMGWVVSKCLASGVPKIHLLWLFPSAWVLGEWLRGWVLSGFPWLTLGYSQIDSPLNGFAPLIGVYGVSWVVLLCVGLLYRLLVPGVRHRFQLAAGLLLVIGSGVMLQQVSWTQPAGEAFRVSMIQANIAQEAKWKRDMLAPTLELYTRLTRDEWQSRLVIWPETAVPAFAHQVETSLLQP